MKRTFAIILAAFTMLLTASCLDRSALNNDGYVSVPETVSTIDFFR